MQLRIDNNLYKVEVIKKKGNRNTYIRVKEDLIIYVTTSYYITEKQIVKLLEENIPSIKKMLDKQIKKNNNKNDFYYLGKKYDVVYTNGQDIILGTDRVFIPKDANLDKWYQKQASVLFLKRLNYNYGQYTRKIPYPSLTIRKMTSRWGVCNLNLELIKKDPICLDYVIMHELTHFIHPNHSKEFWNLVEENCKDCKKIRKIMKEY